MIQGALELVVPVFCFVEQIQGLITVTDRIVFYVSFTLCKLRFLIRI